MFTFKSGRARMLHKYKYRFKNTHNQNSQGFKSEEQEGQIVGKFLEITLYFQSEYEAVPSFVGLSEVAHHLS